MKAATAAHRPRRNLAGTLRRARATLRFLSSAMNATSSRQRLGLCLVLGLALAVRLWGVDFGLPYTYHKDESALVRRTVGFGTGDLNPHSFHWPAFHLYTLFGLYGVLFMAGRAAGVFHSAEHYARLYFTDPTLFYLSGRLLSVLLGTATVYLTYRAGRLLGNARAGLWGALCLALTYYHVRDSHLATLDVPATFWVAVSFVLAVRIFCTPAPRLRDYLLAGSAAGLATASKYNAAVVFLAVLAAHALREVRPPVRNLTAAAAAAACAFLVTNPFVILDWPTFLRDFSFQRHHIAQGQYGLALVPAALFYLQKMMVINVWNSRLFFIDPMIILFLGGVGSLVLSRRRREAALVLIVPLTYLLYIGGWGMAATRYLDPVFPMVALAAGMLLARAPRPLVAAGIIMLGVSLRTVVASDYVLSQTDTRTEAKEWIEKNVPANMKIAIETNAPPLRRSRENLERRAGLLAAGKLHHPTQTPERVRQYYEWRSETAGAIAYDLERLNDNLLDTDAVLANRVPDTNYDVERLRSLGVRYVILSSGLREYVASARARELYPRIVEFYRDLDAETTLVREFRPGSWQPGPVIRIYELGRSR